MAFLQSYQYHIRQCGYSVFHHWVGMPTRPMISIDNPLRCVLRFYWFQCGWLLHNREFLQPNFRTNFRNLMRLFLDVKMSVKLFVKLFFGFLQFAPASHSGQHTDPVPGTQPTCSRLVLPLASSAKPQWLPQWRLQASRTIEYTVFNQHL